MENVFNNDFKEFIRCLNNAKVEYMLVGGYSVILYGYGRTTGDMDVWVNKSKENLINLKKACLEFGLPTNDLTEQNFLENEDLDVFTFGRPPVCIDIMNKLKGVAFSDAFQNSVIMEVDGGPVRVIAKNDLIKAKLSSNRPKDQDDLLHLK